MDQSRSARLVTGAQTNSRSLRKQFEHASASEGSLREGTGPMGGEESLHRRRQQGRGFGIRGSGNVYSRLVQNGSPATVRDCGAADRWRGLVSQSFGTAGIVGWKRSDLELIAHRR